MNCFGHPHGGDGSGLETLFRSAHERGSGIQFHRFELLIQPQVPAQKTGGRYKGNGILHFGFVEASPSRAFRDGEGTFQFKAERYQRVTSSALTTRLRRVDAPSSR